MKLFVVSWWQKCEEGPVRNKHKQNSKNKPKQDCKKNQYTAGELPEKSVLDSFQIYEWAWQKTGGDFFEGWGKVELRP